MIRQHRSLRRALVPGIVLAVASLVVRPQPVVGSIAGDLANDIFGALLGAGAGEGLGCLVQGCSSSDNWSTVSMQLSSLQTQLSSLQQSFQEAECDLSQGVYANYVSGTNADTLNSIATLAADLAAIAADRQKGGDPTKLKQDLNQYNVDLKGTSDYANLPANMNTLVRGTAGAPGGIELLSQALTKCHTYFNLSDFTLLQQQWDLFALSQANACLIKINLDNRANGDPANDIAACKAYQADLLAAQLPQVANPSPLPGVSLDANTFIDIKTGIGWRLGDTVTASYAKEWDNGGGNAFAVWSIPGVGRSGEPWQTLPYYKDVQTMLNDSGCPASGGNLACLLSKGWPPNAPGDLWADSDYSNIVDPSPKGPWAPDSYCESQDCSCANGDCYDWYNVVYQYTGGAAAPSFPPCWTSLKGDGGATAPYGLLAWECGVVDIAAAGFNPVSQANSARSVFEWVGYSNGPTRAPGAPFPPGFYWTGAPPFAAPYVPGSNAP